MLKPRNYHELEQVNLLSQNLFSVVLKVGVSCLMNVSLALDTYQMLKFITHKKDKGPLFRPDKGAVKEVNTFEC